MGRVVIRVGGSGRFAHEDLLEAGTAPGDFPAAAAARVGLLDDGGRVIRRGVGVVHAGPAERAHVEDFIPFVQLSGLWLQSLPTKEGLRPPMASICLLLMIWQKWLLRRLPVGAALDWSQVKEGTERTKTSWKSTSLASASS